MSKSLIYGCQLNGAGDICKVEQCSMFISNFRLHWYTVLVLVKDSGIYIVCLNILTTNS